MLNRLNEKGQALIEFVIILPIFLLLVMGVLDFGNILYQKYKLENSMDYIADLYENDETEDLDAYLDNNNIEMHTRLGDNYAIIEISKTHNVITPGLNIIIGDSYKVSTSKAIYEG